MPRVSVLTPIYNTNPQYLRECIESILNQTFTDFEFLILNDSPNNKEIENIVKEYAKHDKRIKYYKNEKNMGITPSRNKLLDLAKGEYLAIFDHDDISVPERLEKQVKYLDENPQVGVVSGWVEYFGEFSSILKAPETDAVTKIFLTTKCVVPHTAAMIRKSVLINNNIEYEEYYTPCEDYRLWARLMDVTHFYNFQEVLVKYRFLPTNTSHKQSSQMAEKDLLIRNEICDSHMFLKQEYEHKYNLRTKFRLRLFGKIPLIKIKQDIVYLFEFIPLFKIRWK